MTERKRTTHALAFVAAAMLAGEARPQPGFFDDVKEVRELNTTGSDRRAIISATGLEIFFASDRPQGAGGAGDIWVATRDTPDAAFDEPVNVKELNTERGEWPGSLIQDDLVLYFYGRGDLHMTRRPAVGEPFEPPTPLEEINTEQWEGSSSVTGDALEIYFDRANRAFDFGTYDLYVATRRSPSDPFGLPTPLWELNTPGFDGEASITPDGLAISFTSTRSGGQGNADIWMATRDRRYDDLGNRVPFGIPVNLGRPVNSNSVEAQPHLSHKWPDSGARLYFTHRVGGDFQNNDIYEATWHPDCNRNAVDDLEDIRRGTSRDVNGNNKPDECEPLEMFERFRRGDSNADGTVNIADGVATLGFLFAGNQGLTCLDAADTDDSGQIDINDSIGTFNWLFQGAAPPPSPGALTCGVDPTDDGLGCANPSNCQ